MTADAVAKARKLLADPMWRDKPLTEDETSPDWAVKVQGRVVARATFGAGVAHRLEDGEWVPITRLDADTGAWVPDLGWTRIERLDIQEHTDDYGPWLRTTGPASNVEPILNAAVNEARDMLNQMESTRRFVRLLRDEVKRTDDVLPAFADTRESVQQELAATAYMLAMETGHTRNPVVWVAAVLGVSMRTAHRRLDGARSRGLLPPKPTTTTKRGNS